MNPIFIIPGLPEFMVALNAIEEGDRPRVLVALGLMVGLHADQDFRLTGEHYASHPLEVARILIEEFGIIDSDLIIIALLHDTLEDQVSKLVAMTKVHSGDERTIAVNVLAEFFNPYVAAGVLALSNPLYEQPVSPELKRKRYFEHVQEIFASEPGYALVKCADLLCNAGNLHLVQDVARKEKMAKKYVPVLVYIIDMLSGIEDPSHALFPATQSFLPRISSTLESWRSDGEAGGLRYA
jgi:(p)ppGpp synthase/HD superfamily hydrolase